ncbi:MAG: ceramide glucosyltransferase [Verrucomicrobiota bacterium]|jgi:ceramide glucosyltransferase
MTLTAIVLAALALLSVGLSIWQFALSWRFPLHRRSMASPDPASAGISILKPLKGSDAETLECLRSWFAQTYPGPSEILFGVDDANDSACPLVTGLMKEHPGVSAQLIVCSERLGPNAKVSKLALLARNARHEIICVSDADVYVPADFLSNAMMPLKDSQVGLVNCFYRMSRPATFAMRCEAFAVNADFWGQVLQSAMLKPMDFALGAVMLAPRRRLEAIGGFEGLVDYLADDYELGRRLSRHATVTMCPVVVECRSASMACTDVWMHQLRWARTIRVCQPGPYFLSILGNATLWPLLLLAALPTARVFLATALALGWRMTQGFLLERKMEQRGRIDSLWLALTKDLLQVGIWCAAFAGRKVVWRGEHFTVSTEGKLTRTQTPAG